MNYTCRNEDSIRGWSCHGSETLARSLKTVTLGGKDVLACTSSSEHIIYNIIMTEIKIEIDSPRRSPA